MTTELLNVFPKLLASALNQPWVAAGLTALIAVCVLAVRAVVKLVLVKDAVQQAPKGGQKIKCYICGAINNGLNTYCTQCKTEFNSGKVVEFCPVCRTRMRVKEIFNYNSALRDGNKYCQICKERRKVLIVSLVIIIFLIVVITSKFMYFGAHHNWNWESMLATMDR